MRPIEDLAAQLIGQLRARGETVASSESLTGGLFAATLVGVPGASHAVRGGVVVYATELKATLGGLDAGVLRRNGPVSAPTAEGLATAVRAMAGSTWGVSMTGVAGPDPQDGHPVGTVFIGLSASASTVVRQYHFEGDRMAIRKATVVAAIELLAAAFGNHAGS